MAGFPKNKARDRSTLSFRIRVRQIIGVMLVIMLLEDVHSIRVISLLRENAP